MEKFVQSVVKRISNQFFTKLYEMQYQELRNKFWKFEKDGRGIERMCQQS